MVVDGAINGELFLAYVEQVLLPTLREGDIVVMDNLSSHKVAGVEKAILSVGAKILYLPPYSPDFNPIENVFSKLKTLVRKSKCRRTGSLFCYSVVTRKSGLPNSTVSPFFTRTATTFPEHSA